MHTPQILAAESFSHKDDGRVQKTIRVLYEHIRGVARIPGLAGARCYLGVENNLGNDAWNIIDRLTGYIDATRGVDSVPDVTPIREASVSSESIGALGIHTGPKVKASMAGALGHLVAEGRVVFHGNFMSVTNYKQPDIVRDELCEQMLRYKRIAVPKQNDLNKMPTITYSGKSGGRLDDLVMALQLAYLSDRRLRTPVGEIGRFNPHIRATGRRRGRA